MFKPTLKPTLLCIACSLVSAASWADTSLQADANLETSTSLRASAQPGAEHRHSAQAGANAEPSPGDRAKASAQLLGAQQGSGAVRTRAAEPEADQPRSTEAPSPTGEASLAHTLAASAAVVANAEQGASQLLAGTGEATGQVSAVLAEDLVGQASAVLAEDVAGQASAALVTDLAGQVQAAVAEEVASSVQAAVASTVDQDINDSLTLGL